MSVLAANYCLSWVKLRRTQCEQMSSELPLKADIAQHTGDVSKVPTRDSCIAAKSFLFDHLVGDGEQGGRHGEAERLGGLTINDEFELCRQLDG